MPGASRLSVIDRFWDLRDFSCVFSLDHGMHMLHIESTETEKYLPARQVRHRLGGISNMTLYRWLENEGLGFPVPVYFGRNRFWRLSDLQDWEARQPRNLSKREAA